ncbi:unnamed protein product [Orchesella dallaii]|uniref:Cytochrome b5 heme-binding domain-containing protein n=1 Tax=Orchesella dallaii TaxID=48710 RepID=A0ABP1R043_9HEXA
MASQSSSDTSSQESKLSEISSPASFDEDVGTYDEFQENLTPSLDGRSGAGPKAKVGHRRKRKIDKYIYVNGGEGDQFQSWIYTILIAVVAAFVGAYIISAALPNEPESVPEPHFTDFLQKDVNLNTYAKGTDPRKTLKKPNQKIDWRQHFDELEFLLPQGQIKIMSDADIKYKEGEGLFVVVAGFVFDVSEAPNMYGKDAGYHGFVGRDGTRAFVTGKFDDEGLTPNLEGLTPTDYKGISDWINFYLNHEVYKFVGLHKGWYFDDKGLKTKHMIELEKALTRADELDAAMAEDEKLFPGCNMEWTAEKGSHVWCSKNSGGINRDWAGLPRNFVDGDKPSRCVCTHPNFLADPRIKLFDGCNPKSEFCNLKN